MLGKWKRSVYHNGDWGGNKAPCAAERFLHRGRTEGLSAALCEEYESLLTV